MDKFCICGARVECDSGGYTCPRCFRRYSTKGKLINSFSNSLIEFDERATQLANYSAAADGHTHWCPECKMREARIAELEQELKNQVELHNEWLGTYRIKLDYIEELERKIKRLTT